MKAIGKASIRTVQLTALVAFCVAAILAVSLPLVVRAVQRARATELTVDPYEPIALTDLLGACDRYTVSGPSGEWQTTEPSLVLYRSGLYLVRGVTVNEDSVVIRKCTISVRKDTVLPVVTAQASQSVLNAGTGTFFTVNARDNFTPSDEIGLTFSCNNCSVRSVGGRYCVVGTAEGDASVKVRATDTAGNVSSCTVTLRVLRADAPLDAVTQGTAILDPYTLVCVGEADISLVAALPIGAYELAFTGGTLVLTDAHGTSVTETQKHLSVEVTEQGAVVNGITLIGRIFLQYSGTDCVLTSSRALYSPRTSVS